MRYGRERQVAAGLFLTIGVGLAIQAGLHDASPTVSAATDGPVAREASTLEPPATTLRLSEEVAAGPHRLSEVLGIASQQAQWPFNLEHGEKDGQPFCPEVRLGEVKDMSLADFQTLLRRQGLTVKSHPWGAVVLTSEALVNNPLDKQVAEFKYSGTLNGFIGALLRTAGAEGSERVEVSAQAMAATDNLKVSVDIAVNTTAREIFAEVLSRCGALYTACVRPPAPKRVIRSSGVEWELPAVRLSLSIVPYKILPKQAEGEVIVVAKKQEPTIKGPEK